MIVMSIYIIGSIIAIILGSIILWREPNKENLQVGMLAPMAILSWVSVAIIIWKRKVYFK